MMPVQCASCIFYSGGRKCEAYPKGIPDKILTGEVDHTEPYKGDHGIQFELIEDN